MLFPIGKCHSQHYFRLLDWVGMFGNYASEDSAIWAVENAHRLQTRPLIEATVRQRRWLQLLRTQVHEEDSTENTFPRPSV
ncbi:hypothetical protein N7528_009040 [Penicillium herquei]|nr:hypothetical protein N7528_009040 [Penicillium herquei]